MVKRESWTALALLLTATAAATEPPSYARQVRPFVAKYCLECHSADKSKGGLNLETHQTLLRGGDNGPVIAPGKPEESRLVLMVEGKDKRVMPPKTAKQPPAEERSLFRAWVAAGAKDDGPATVRVPDVKPRRPVAVPVAALAYAPDGRSLAVAGAGELLLLDVASGEQRTTVAGQTGRV